MAEDLPWNRHERTRTNSKPGRKRLTADCDVFGRGLVALGRAMATAGRGLATSGRSLATLYLVVGEVLLRVGRCSGCLFLFGMLVGPVGWLSRLTAPRFG
jgi:hypothetical protein